MFWLHLELVVSNTRNRETNLISSLIAMNKCHHLLKTLSPPHWWTNQTYQLTACISQCSAVFYESMNQWRPDGYTDSVWTNNASWHTVNIPWNIIKKNLETTPPLTILQLYNSSFQVETKVRTTRASVNFRHQRILLTLITGLFIFFNDYLIHPNGLKFSKL